MYKGEVMGSENVFEMFLNSIVTEVNKILLFALTI